MRLLTPVSCLYLLCHMEQRRDRSRLCFITPPCCTSSTAMSTYRAPSYMHKYCAYPFRFDSWRWADETFSSMCSWKSIDVDDSANTLYTARIPFVPLCSPFNIRASFHCMRLDDLIDCDLPTVRYLPLFHTTVSYIWV